MIYADTSFIASFYLDDIHTEKALAYVEKHQPRLPFVFLHWPELSRSVITASPDAEADWDAIKTDVAAGEKFYHAEVDALRTAKRAAGLLWNFCPRWQKLRSLDAMHVAAAIESGCKTFLSFDENSHQRVLATTQKLDVWPPLSAEEKARLK